MSTEPSPCPLCRSAGRTKIADQTLPDLADSGRSPELPVRTVAYLVCADCGTVSMDPLPDPAGLDRYYAAAPLEVGGPEQQAVLAALNVSRLDLLRESIGPLAGRCLDVGSGGGGLPALLASQTPLEVWSLEPCPPAVSAPGVNAVAGTLADAAGLPEAFELVTCLSVLEHVHDPAAFLDLLTARVAPGGVLMLEVPSAELLARGAKTAYGQNIYPLHLHHFAAPGLLRALQDRGLAPILLCDRLVEGYPLLTMILRRTGPDRPAALFTAQLDRQLAAARRARARLAQLAEKLDGSGGQVLVWGAGVDALEMITCDQAPWPRNCDLFDRSGAKQGRALAGVPILDEAGLAGRTYAAVAIAVRHPALGRVIAQDAAALLPGARVVFLFSDEE